MLFYFISFGFCQKVKDVEIYNYKLYTSNGTELIQTKNGLTVEIIPLSPGLLYKYPELFSWDMGKLPLSWTFKLESSFDKYTDGKYYYYPFGIGDNFLNVYKIKITNSTGHIIRMADARMFMRIEGEDPIKPVIRFGDPTLVDINPPSNGIISNTNYQPKSAIEKDNSLIHWVTWMCSEWDNSKKKAIIHVNFPIGFPSQILAQNRKACKLINDVDVEILPDDSYSGILLFPRLISDNELSIKMYDFSTKTDAAGNVTEKSNFDFKLKLTEGTEYFDKNIKAWIQGEPPQKVEYYDKKQKKWFFGVPQK